MEYFIIGTSKYCNNPPKLLDWEKCIQPRNINKNESYLIAQTNTIEVESDSETIFPDMLTYPFRMVSEEFRKVISLYESDLLFKQVLLLEKKNKKSHIYYIPILEEVDCLHEDSIHVPGTLKKAVIDQRRAGRYNIFLVRKTSDSYIVGNLDFVESLLRRGVLGIDLTVAQTNY